MTKYFLRLPARLEIPSWTVLLEALKLRLGVLCCFDTWHIGRGSNGLRSPPLLDKAPWKGQSGGFQVSLPRVCITIPTRQVHLEPGDTLTPPDTGRQPPTTPGCPAFLSATATWPRVPRGVALSQAMRMHH